MEKDIKGIRIYHSELSSDGSRVYNMEYNIIMGWMCSCKSYQYRRVCKHVIKMNEEMNDYGRCTDCKHMGKDDCCDLWKIYIDNKETFTCGGWEQK